MIILAQFNIPGEQPIKFGFRTKWSAMAMRNNLRPLLWEAFDDHSLDVSILHPDVEAEPLAALNIKVYDSVNEAAPGLYRTYYRRLAGFTS